MNALGSSDSSNDKSLSRLKSLLLTNSKSPSPVIPSGSVAQLRQRSSLGSGDLYLGLINSRSRSWSSKILRNSIQTSWESRWASPSTPASLRMMSWIFFITDWIDIVLSNGVNLFKQLRYERHHLSFFLRIAFGNKKRECG